MTEEKQPEENKTKLYAQRPETTPKVRTDFNADGLVLGYYCPKCNEPALLHHTDSRETKWFKCSKCGEFSTKPKTEEQRQLEKTVEKLKDIHRTTTLDEVAAVLSTTIKKDEKNKVLTFLSMLLTYTESDQINVGFNSESSTGKSYIPLELAWYFPKEDVLKYGYVSPTAFFHEAGIMIDDPRLQKSDGDELRPIEDSKEDSEERQRKKIIWIDLEKKILIFLDQPHDMLLQRLRPLLSHDEKVVYHEITDRSKTGGLITKTVGIKGYSSVVFCTTKFSMEDQEKTRQLFLSAESTKEKIQEAIRLKIEKDSDKDSFHKYMETNPKRQWLKNRIEDIKREDIKNIIIPEELKKKIENKFFGEHENLIPRHQRDIGRLMAMIKAHCLLNLWSRERKDDNIVADLVDIDEGFKIYEEVAQSNEIGLPPEVYDLWQKFELNIPEAGLSRRDFERLYYVTFHRILGSHRFKEIIDLLSSVGLLSEEPDPNDKRQKRIVSHRSSCIYISPFIASLREMLSGVEEASIADSAFEDLCKAHFVEFADLLKLQSAGVVRTSLIDSSLVTNKGFVKVAFTKEGEK
jgi:DNA-directed RNA polymerase subunit M/transcription elongation factor TFIIS